MEWQEEKCQEVMRTTVSINGSPTAFNEIFRFISLDLIPLELVIFFSIYLSHMRPLNGKPLHMIFTSLLRYLSFDFQSRRGGGAPLRFLTYLGHQSRARQITFSGSMG